MRLKIKPKFDEVDLRLIHDWVGKRGWKKSRLNPFGYAKIQWEDAGDGIHEYGTGEVACSLFDALLQEIQDDLDELNEEEEEEEEEEEHYDE